MLRRWKRRVNPKFPLRILLKASTQLSIFSFLDRISLSSISLKKVSWTLVPHLHAYKFICVCTVIPPASARLTPSPSSLYPRKCLLFSSTHSTDSSPTGYQLALTSTIKIYTYFLNPAAPPLPFMAKLLCSSLLTSHLLLSGAIIESLSPLSPSQAPACPLNVGVWVTALGPFPLSCCYFCSTQQSLSTSWISVSVESMF